MQNIMAQIITNLGLRALEKSRGYYYPPGVDSMADAVEMNDAEFATLIQNIDRFSAQFLAAHAKQMGPK